MSGDAGYKPGMTESTSPLGAGAAENTISADVPESMHGCRLDQALELLLPGEGLRARKRAWERCRVLVDGRERPKGYRVQAGQVLALEPRDAARQDSAVQIPEGMRVVGQSTGAMAALFKPAGVHSEDISGRPGLTAQACLPLFWPGRFAQLVNRLDQPTSGLLLVALAPETAKAYRALEDAGRVEKAYVALVRGRVERPFTMRRAIDAADRKRVRVLDADIGDFLRHTRVEPLREVPDLGATVVRALIAKGARHQIRAHLAAAGAPIVGDELYGAGAEEGGLYLHHFRVTLPDFQAAAPPAWPQWGRWGIPKASI